MFFVDKNLDLYLRNLEKFQYPLFSRGLKINGSPCHEMAD
jgi:hypothetical protein